MSEKLQQDTSKIVSNKRAALKGRFAQAGKGLGEAYKSLRPPAVPSTAFLEGDDGTLKAAPDEIDDIVMRGWGKVFAGG
eukprot:8587790-Alexandrium_andersonii.AAC.1